ncbi:MULTISPECIES: hypothetical protein [unclassified Streptomyces]|uniref:hypothetical protein n=1 Tax=unclassified Streptomyces TaxID=2593676 RepID=UPI0029A24A7F|nr:hypothetical protein [Streptomyces sp. DK15]MDX2395237.1 hypothetical protein [Streptomyces sp. DK15]
MTTPVYSPAMNDQEAEVLLERVRWALAELGFEEIATGAEGVYLIEHARGVMIGWVPQDITPPHGRGEPDLLGLRRAFGLALAAALRGAGFTVETRDDEWLLVLDALPDLP